jgi:hypothetical protein
MGRKGAGKIPRFEEKLWSEREKLALVEHAWSIVPQYFACGCFLMTIERPNTLEKIQTVLYLTVI